MNPATILLIIQALEAAVGAAPQVIAVFDKAKDLVNALFTANLITAAQQDAICALIDARAQLAAAGIVPDAWKVEPDPAPAK